MRAILFVFVSEEINLDLRLYCFLLCSVLTADSTLYTRTHTVHNYGTCGVLHCLLFCDQTRPNLRISLVGYHCAIEFPCGVPLFYCCKYPTTYGVRVHVYRHCREKGRNKKSPVFGHRSASTSVR